ncbi:MAG: SUMF1/EgtB/PvdO family nonheme iron enzyme [Planctomycetia bacterium]|nr:SUMF1/EgtB/PvdO family nonheme iron enzyme [Planctomycetia bacterium]
MSRFLPRIFIILLLASYAFSNTNLSAAEQSTRNWPGDKYGVAQKEVSEDHLLNLLTFPDAKMTKATNVTDASLLIDGNLGSCGGYGRVEINGNPSRIVFYLGKVKKINQIKIWTGNIDSRSHQDWEVRLANNASNPGQEPDFPAAATFTSGDKILGAERGAFCSTIKNADNSNLGEADWIEFKIWRTYPSRPGDPAKSASPARSWASALELVCLADPNDPNLFPSEEARQQWLRKQTQLRMAIKLASISPDVASAIKNMEALRLMIESLAKEFPEEYDAATYLAEWEKYNKAFQNFSENSFQDEDSVNKLLALVKDFNTFRRKAIFSNPYLKKFDKILARQSKDGAFMSNWLSPCDRNRRQYFDKLITVNVKDLAEASAESFGRDAKLTTIFEEPNGSLLADICLHWDADRMLVTALNPQYKRWQIYELKIDGTGYRQITPDMGKDIDNAEGCYVPDGSILFCSSASMMGVPCIGGASLVANIFRVETDGKTVRQLTFEQDQDWFPTVTNNGRIMFLRWEYVDMCHYYSRILMTMNPDGTRQLATYGSGSYWPNSLFYAKSVPGHPTKFTGIVSGHHGVARIGELYVFDPTLGDHEADGVVQQIPGRGKKVEPRIVDQLVDNSWPKFVCPTPLSENYILVNCKPTPNSLWGLYLVDTFDNMTLLYESPDFVLWEPTPVQKRPTPPVIAPQFVDGSTEATAFISDVYFGPGLKDVPRGTVKKLRIFSYQYGYRGIGNHNFFGLESSWDAKRIIGEVPVYEDGSASFKIPANTPISLQPIDENGSALQLFRSWLVGMPGERVSCIGCHENQNSVTPRKLVEASRKPVSEITPFYGPVRGFGFLREVQPVLDKYCVGCHDGSKPERPNFADISPSYATFSVSYHNLVRYVRRPGPESDQRMFNPMEYHTNTSELFQILNKGHYNVQLDDESWHKLYAWVDCNAPYYPNWMEIAASRNRTSHVENMASRTQQLRSLYANIQENPEEDYYHEKQERPAWIKPDPLPEVDRSAPAVEGFPFKVPEDYTPPRQTVELPGGKFDMVQIPAGKFVTGDEMGEPDEFPRKVAEIKKPFWMMTTEVTNALYNLYDPKHDSRHIDQWWKDHTTPGYPANLPNQPVIRISWNEAQGFCKWLSEKTGKKFRLPTEEEWEYAARAGSGDVFSFGGINTDFSKYANMADESVHLFYVTGVNPQPSKHQEWQMWIPHAKDINDRNFMQAPVGSYQPNSFGLHDMHGNVWEWTASAYKDGTELKTVKGGSWYDRPHRCRAGMKLPYQAWQKVETVGFRVICED